MKFIFQLIFFAFLSNFSHSANSKGKQELSYKLVYDVRFSIVDSSALVKLSIDNSSLVKLLDFNLRHHNIDQIESNGETSVKDGRLVWTLPKNKAWLKYKIKIGSQKEDGRFDARITPSWAIFRGDELVPPARSRFVSGARANTKIRFSLPKAWHSVNTGWQRLSSESKKRNAEFKIVNRRTRFDRPIGWIIAGDIGTRRELIGDTWVSASAPVGENFRRMDILTLLQFVWSDVQKAFKKMPDKLLLVGAGDPFWKGGLSGPRSLFLHTQRPLVSENGTSTLLHEIVHVITGIHGEPLSDWIAEGIAEFYSVELLYRAGGISDSRREIILEELADWSKSVTRLDLVSSTGATTAKAALFFYALDKELKEVSGNQINIDNLTRHLMKKDKVAAKDIGKTFVLLTGKKSSVFAEWSKLFPAHSSGI